MIKTSTLLCIFTLLNFHQAISQSTSIPIEVRKFEVVQKEGKHYVQMELYNSGKFFAYPIVQVEVNNELIANKEGSFDSYGILQESTQLFEYPADLSNLSGKLRFTILVSSGMQKGTYKIEYEYEL